MYRCDICRAVAQPRQARLTHAITRDVPRKVYDDWGVAREVFDKQIAREIPVCPRCYGMLKLGCTLEQVREQRGKPAETPMVVVEVAIPRPAPVFNKPLAIGRPVALSTLPLERLGNVEVIKKKVRSKVKR